ncbi:hypothetical protein KR074_011427 [Drosophila pseudoananassae]|nr:hypothetical protein KR074_011427 [Drosophila pseudoananassae]
MANVDVSEFLSMNDPLHSTGDDFLEHNVVELKEKLHEILANQDEILSLLNQVSKMKQRIDPSEYESDYFPLTDATELHNLDAELADKDNIYALMMKRILRPNGQVEPLKKNWSKLFDYEILIAFNYDGVCTKESFKKFKNINRTIFEIQKTSGYTQTDYIKDIKAAFHTVKTRFHKRNYDLKRKLERAECDGE